MAWDGAYHGLRRVSDLSVHSYAPAAPAVLAAAPENIHQQQQQFYAFSPLAAAQHQQNAVHGQWTADPCSQPPTWGYPQWYGQRHNSVAYPNAHGYWTGDEGPLDASYADIDVGSRHSTVASYYEPQHAGYYQHSYGQEPSPPRPPPPSESTRKNARGITSIATPDKPDNMPTRQRGGRGATPEGHEWQHTQTPTSNTKTPPAQRRHRSAYGSSGGGKQPHDTPNTMTISVVDKQRDQQQHEEIQKRQQQLAMDLMDQESQQQRCPTPPMDSRPTTPTVASEQRHLQSTPEGSHQAHNEHPQQQHHLHHHHGQHQQANQQQEQQYSPQAAGQGPPNNGTVPPVVVGEPNHTAAVNQRQLPLPAAGNNTHHQQQQHHQHHQATCSHGSQGIGGGGGELCCHTPPRQHINKKPFNTPPQQPPAHPPPPPAMNTSSRRIGSQASSVVGKVHHTSTAHGRMTTIGPQQQHSSSVAPLRTHKQLSVQNQPHPHHHPQPQTTPPHHPTHHKHQPHQQAPTDPQIVRQGSSSSTSRVHGAAAAGGVGASDNAKHDGDSMILYILWVNPLIPFSRFVMMAATQLNHTWESKHVELTNLASEWYLAKNPNAEVPTLEHGGRCMHEAMAILRYLAYNKESTDFYPYEIPYKLANVELAIETMRNKLIDPLKRIVHHKVILPKMQHKVGDAAIIEKAEKDIDNGMDALEERFFKETPFYIVNGVYTAADTYLCCLMSQLQLVEYRRIGKLDLYFTTMKSDQIFQSAHREFDTVAFELSEQPNPPPAPGKAFIGTS